MYTHNIILSLAWTQFFWIVGYTAYSPYDDLGGMGKRLPESPSDQVEFLGLGKRRFPSPVRYFSGESLESGEKRSPVWRMPAFKSAHSMRMGKRAPLFGHSADIAFGKREDFSDLWGAGVGKRNYEELVGAGLGKRAQNNEGKEAPRIFSYFGKRSRSSASPGMYAYFGKRSPGTFAYFGKRNSGRYAYFGKRNSGKYAYFGKRNVYPYASWFQGFAKREPYFLMKKGINSLDANVRWAIGK